MIRVTYERKQRARACLLECGFQSARVPPATRRIKREGWTGPGGGPGVLRWFWGHKRAGGPGTKPECGLESMVSLITLLSRIGRALTGWAPIGWAKTASLKNLTAPVGRCPRLRNGAGAAPLTLYTL